MAAHATIPPDFHPEDTPTHGARAIPTAVQSSAAEDADRMIAKLRDKKFSRMIAIVGVVAALGPILVSAVLWTITLAGDKREDELLRAQEQARMAEVEEDLAAHISASQAAFGEIKQATIENQVLFVDSVDHLSRKLDSMSQKAVVEGEPDVLTAARLKTKAAKANAALFAPVE